DYYIPIELERALSTGLLIHFIVSSLLNCLAFYCLLRETPPNQHELRYYLLSIQAILFLFDLTLDILVEPIPLFPVPAVYLVGILSRSGVPLRLLFAAFIFITALFMSAIALCIFHKHQTIMDVSNRFKISK
ncbi:hypothetical protein PENTCL1PPCAC_7763, partial [Pristionchus entomophagus]